MSRLMAGLDATEGKEEADDATKAIESLAIKKEGDATEEGK